MWEFRVQLESRCGVERGLARHAAMKVNDVIADLQSLALAKCTDNLILLAELCSLRRGFQHVQT